MYSTHKDTPIFYTDQGSGAPVILLHGFLENQEMWDFIAPQLAAQYRVITIDLLGHGNSKCIGYVHTMDDFACAVHAVVEDLALPTMSIIGHSMGGYVGLAFAKAFPEKVTSLCLLNSTPEPDDEERKKLRTRAVKMAKTQYESLVRMSVGNLFDPELKKQFASEIGNAVKQALKTPVQGYIAANLGMSARDDTTDFWKKSSFKKGMLLGKTDWIIDADQHTEIFKNYTDFHRVLAGGHMMHITNRDATLNEIINFMSF